jgi:hypothetical protein
MKFGINQPDNYKESLPVKDMCNAKYSKVQDHDGNVPGINAGDDVNFVDMKPVPKKGEY